MTSIVAALLALAAFAPLCAGQAPCPGTARGMIQTVCGPLAPEALGLTLTHEHVMVDFIGADKASPDRYDADEVFRTMLPHLTALKTAGVDALVECTPNYLGRDPALLRRLSEASGVRLLTNTGLYKAPYLPRWADEKTAEQIAAEWIREATEGIGPDHIRPGFIKIAVEPDGVSAVQAKIVKAAALAAKATGLTICTHTGTGRSALEQLDILDEVGLPAWYLVVVHIDGEPDLSFHERIAARGAWLSYDGIREGNAQERLKLVMEGLRRWPDQLLISQDAGWYNVGEPGGGMIVPWDWLPREFLKMLRGAGATEEQIRQLMVSNPARAFTIRPACEAPAAPPS